MSTARGGPVGTLTERLAGWAASLRLEDVPRRVISYAKSQVLAHLGAARAGMGHETGAQIVAAFGGPLQEEPKRAAYVLAALTMVLDFDDTAYAGHLSHSTVGVPLAYARALRLDGAGLLAAVIAANECAARLTAAATLGPFRGQTASHTHLVGAPAARLKAAAAAPAQLVSAWGLALALPPWPLLPGFLGSDAKALTASVPVLAALDACDAAAAGLSGRGDIVEHPDGFLARFAAVPLPDAVAGHLGIRWHTETLSLKVYPGCAYLDAAVDCAIGVHRELASTPAAEIDEVVVHASLFTVEMERQSDPYLDGPRSPLSALEFSARYAVATALLTGRLEPADFEARRISSAERWQLARRVRVEHDPQLTVRAVRATAPLGEALRQAGERARPWLERIGGSAAQALLGSLGEPTASFEHADKAIGARLEVRLRDGTRLERTRDSALGAAGPATRSTHAELARAKFTAAGGPQAAADAWAQLEELDAAALTEAIGASLAPPGGPWHAPRA